MSDNQRLGGVRGFKIETQAEAKNNKKAELAVSHPLLLLASLAVSS